MGFLASRSITLVEFRVSGVAPSEGDWPLYAGAIERYRFPLSDDREEVEEVCGWTAPGEAFAAPEGVSLVSPPYLLLSFRLDRRTVPSKLLNHRRQREEESLTRERGVERLSRREKREIRERLHRSLLRQTLPSIRVFDMIWHVGEGRVLFTGSGQRVRQLFAELFERTFGRTLTRESLMYRGGVPIEAAAGERSQGEDS